ncbi:uncharacterized protein [Cicer arietinum]|uniref:uncharacterized protein n=1 Tax=Cicer arietinum TaxID=3827 RepID=UPI003CC5059E
MDEIRALQAINEAIQGKQKLVETGNGPEFEMGPDNILRCNKRICVPDNAKLRKTISNEAHKSKLSNHPSSTKMLTKSTHFILVKTTYDVLKLVEIYVVEIVRLHRIPSNIAPNRDPKFTSLWGALHELSCKHQEGTVQGFVWAQVSNSLMLVSGWLNLDRMVRVGATDHKEGVSNPRANETTQSMHKSYVDRYRRPLEFQEGEHVFLRVKLTTRDGKALKYKKLTLKFIQPNQILRRVGLVAYQIALPPNLANLYDMFHVSQLRKYMADPPHIISSYDIQLKENLSFEVSPISIIDRTTKHLRGKEIPLVKGYLELDDWRCYLGVEGEDEGVLPRPLRYLLVSRTKLF